MSKASAYLSQFERVKSFKLRGNRLLVEPLPKEEIKSAGGLILAAPLSDHRSTLDQNRACLAVILCAGEGYYDDETNETVSLDLQVGNIVLISAYGLRAYSNFPGVVGYKADSIALIRDSDVTAAWSTRAAYDAFASELASGAAKEA